MTAPKLFVKRFSNFLPGSASAVLCLACFFLFAACGGQSQVVATTAGKVIHTNGHSHSLIESTESFVIIPGNTHTDLWVHPELVTIPGSPAVIELRVRPTDRNGKDRHGDFIRFSTSDDFKTLQPLDSPHAEYWQRTRLSKNQLSPDSMQIPSMGHTWSSPWLYTDSNTIIQAFTTKNGKQNSVQTMVIKKKGHTLKPVHISNAWTVDKGRGMYEPHIAEYKGKYYMSARAEDGHGYIMVSSDKGYSWSKPVRWKWNDGTDIAMNQTMTKIMSHSNGLVLVYTRITDKNERTFRNRAPLFCADIDPETLALKKETEIIVVPDKGLAVGNFWVWPINQEESYIATAEWPRDGRLENGDIWLVKVKWKQPNNQVTNTGVINIP